MNLSRTTTGRLQKRIESRINNTISLVASESLEYQHIKESLCSVSHQLTVEGSLKHRYFPVPPELDELEEYASKRCAELFNFTSSDIRPTTATHANISVYLSFLNRGDKILFLSVGDGGHISHGHKNSFAGKNYNCVPYNIEDDGSIDLDKLSDLIKEQKPKLVISGGSSCPRVIRHHKIAKISHKNGALHLADISHIAGLIAGGVIENNLMESDIATFGMQKTFLGPRGGVVLTKNKYLKRIEKGIFPGVEGAMIVPQIIAKAYAIEFAFTAKFRRIQQRILRFSYLFSQELKKVGIDVVTGGSDTHIVLIRIKNAAKIVDNLYRAGIRCNFNPIPKSKEWGIRFGTTSLAQTSIKEDEVRFLFENLSKYIKANSENCRRELKNSVGSAINRGYNRMQRIRPGNFVANSRVGKREKLTFKSLVRSQHLLEKMNVPLVIYNRKKKNTFFGNKKVAVVIPSIGTGENVKSIIDYIRKNDKNTMILVIDSNTNLRKCIMNVKKNVFRISTAVFSGYFFNLKLMNEILCEGTDISKGKGWSMFIGYLFSYANSIEHLFFIDGDLVDIDRYDPLNKLAQAIDSESKINHAVIATPNRRNEIIHGVLNALEPRNPSLILQLKQYIHFLAGERYINMNCIEKFPWLSNYGIETWLNIYCAHRNIKSVQVSNDERRDAINSYEKNEIMLMYCSKLISLVLDSGILECVGSFEKAINFNRKLKKWNQVTILPISENQNIRSYVVHGDCLIPSFDVLKKHGLINKELNCLKLSAGKYESL